MRNDFSKYYATADDKYKSTEFDKNVKKENQIETKGIEVDIYFILATNIQNR